MGWNELELTGKRFGKLVGIERVGKTARQVNIWRFACDCGNTVDIDTLRLKRLRIPSCGCVKRASGAHRDALRLKNLERAETVKTIFASEKMGGWYWKSLREWAVSRLVAER